jgi:hypothetical protein
VIVKVFYVVFCSKNVTNATKHLFNQIDNRWFNVANDLKNNILIDKNSFDRHQFVSSLRQCEFLFNKAKTLTKSDSCLALIDEKLVEIDVLLFESSCNDDFCMKNVIEEEKQEQQEEKDDLKKPKQLSNGWIRYFDEHHQRNFFNCNDESVWNENEMKNDCKRKEEAEEYGANVNVEKERKKGNWTEYIGSSKYIGTPQMSKEHLDIFVERLYGKGCDPAQTRVVVGSAEREAGRLSSKTFATIVNSLRECGVVIIDGKICFVVCV